MNWPLFLSMMRSHSKMLGGFIYGSVAYMILVVWIYPSIADMRGFNEMMKKLPEGMLKLIGMEDGISSLGDYMASEFYGILFLIILMVYVILTSTKVMARLVDQGSMAYLLATPNSRTKITITQAVVLLTGLFSIIFCTMISGIIASKWLISGYSLDINAFIKMNIMTFLVFSVVAGYCFLFSCINNDEKKALGFSAGLTLLFYMLNMAGKLSSKTDWLLHFTIFKAYDPIAYMHEKKNVLELSTGFGVIAILLFVISVYSFKKRNLPL